MFYNNITGIVLAGGKSSRMGVDKSLLTINNKTLVEITFDSLSKIFHRVIIISDKENKFDLNGAEQFEDIFTNLGPLGGIHSGLKHSNDNLNFVISCDLPMVSNELITYLCEHHGNHDVTIPQFSGQIHFLCGVYSRICIQLIEAIFHSGRNDAEPGLKNFNFSIKKLVASLQANIVISDKLHFISPLHFFNVNTPEDLRFIRSKMKSEL
ncbi:MAG: molybdenum cofactor guanylyltransferase [Ignavibacteriales bacterium]|nr:MAG: molybdenum cofactor guanylyltransferase [Ignavibacteriales bacterium]